MLNGFILFKIYVIFGYIYTIIFESAAKHCFIILYMILGIKKILATSYFSYSLSSAFRCLTSVFGMGTGEPPSNYHQYIYFFYFLSSLKTR